MFTLSGEPPYITYHLYIYPGIIPRKPVRSSSKGFLPHVFKDCSAQCRSYVAHLLPMPITATVPVRLDVKGLRVRVLLWESRMKNQSEMKWKLRLRWDLLSHYYVEGTYVIMFPWKTLNPKPPLTSFLTAARQAMMEWGWQ